MYSRAATVKLTSSQRTNLAASIGKSSQFDIIHKWYNEWRTRRNFRQQAFAVRVINAFIDAHCQAQRHVASFFGQDALVDTPEEAIAIVESQIQVFEAATLRGLIGREMQMRVNTMWIVHCFAEQYRNFVLRVHETGVLQGKEAEQLLHPIAGAMRELHKERKKIYAAINTDHCKSQMTAVEAAAVIQRYIKRMKVRKNINIVRQSVCSTTVPIFAKKPGPEPAMMGLAEEHHSEDCEEYDAGGVKPSSEDAGVTSTPVLPVQIVPEVPGTAFVGVE